QPVSLQPGTKSSLPVTERQTTGLPNGLDRLKPGQTVVEYGPPPVSNGNLAPTKNAQIPYNQVEMNKLTPPAGQGLPQGNDRRIMMPGPQQADEPFRPIIMNQQARNPASMAPQPIAPEIAPSLSPENTQIRNLPPPR